MKQFFFQTLGLVAVIIGALYFTSSQNIMPGKNQDQSQGGAVPDSPNSQKILQIIDGASNDNIKRIKAEISIEISDTKEKRSLGLSGRESLASDSGMLFLYEKADKYRFWMKGMKIPLDFIWINDSRVVDLLKNIEPPKNNQADKELSLVAPIVAVDKILEVNAGFINSHNIKVGDKIEY